jgi:hypothetical protein
MIAMDLLKAYIPKQRKSQTVPKFGQNHSRQESFCDKTQSAAMERHWMHEPCTKSENLIQCASSPHQSLEESILAIVTGFAEFTEKPKKVRDLV